MKSLWKRLTARFTANKPSQTEPQRGSSIQPGVGTPVPTLGSCPNNPINPERVESKPPAFQNASEPHEHESSPFDNLPYNRNGKIARLPRPLRDRINQALYNRCTAKDLARALNQMPQVKAVLAQYFDGRPLKTQNIYEWKQGGYRDWLHHREILEQQRELNADAKDMADTANGMADSLFGMLTLDYAQLIMKRDSQTPEEFEKHWKKLGLQSQDIVRLRRCHLNARRVDVQETRLERDHEKTEEQLVFKFMEWTENPEVRKALILEPMERRRRLRQIYEMPPTPEDILVEKETRNDPYFHPRGKNQAKCKPKPAKKTQSDAEGVNPPTDTKGGASGDASLPASRSDKTSDAQEQEDTVGTRRCASAADRQVSPTTASSLQPSNSSTSTAGEGELNLKSKTQNSTLPDYAGKTTSQIIAEIEEKHAREKAARLNAQKTSDAQGPENSVGTRCCASDLQDKGVPNSKPKPPLSDYDRALLEGKTHLEALYIHSAPKSANADSPRRSPAQRDEDRTANSQSAARPPGASAWDSFSEPVHYSPHVYSSHHTAYNFKLTGG